MKYSVLFILLFVVSVAQAGPQFETPPIPGKFLSYPGPVPIPNPPSAAELRKYFAAHPAVTPPPSILQTVQTMPVMPRADPPRFNAQEVYPGVFLDQSLRR